MDRDLDRLQGSWAITSLEVDGQPAPVSDARIVVEGNRFTTIGMGAEYRGILTLDTAASPSHIDMRFDAGPEKGNTNRCIYEIDGETWRLCIATRGPVRPSSFSTTPGSGFALETLTRGGAPKAENARKKTSKQTTRSGGTPTEFEGEWQMVSGVMNGQVMDADTMKWVKRVTHGNQTTVYAASRVMMEVEFTHDSAKSPKTIDYINTAGSNKGRAQYGIYEFEDGVLRVHVAQPGTARPDTFEAGRTGTLTVWKRA